MNIYIDVSHDLEFMPGVVADKIDEMMSNGDTFLFGPPGRSDHFIIDHVANENYKNAILYGYHWNEGMSNRKWPIIALGDESDPDFFEEDIDELMRINDADCGLIIWDNVDNGVIGKAAELLKIGKPVTFYALHCHSFFHVNSLTD